MKTTLVSLVLGSLLLVSTTSDAGSHPGAMHMHGGGGTALPISHAGVGYGGHWTGNGYSFYPSFSVFGYGFYGWPAYVYPFPTFTYSSPINDDYDFAPNVDPASSHLFPDLYVAPWSDEDDDDDDF